MPKARLLIHVKCTHTAKLIDTAWAMEVAIDPYDPDVYDPETGDGALAVEFVAPGVTSKALEDPDTAALAEEAVMATQPHLRYVDLLRRGYMLLDVAPEQMQAEWHYTPSVTYRTMHEIFGHAERTVSGNARLEEVRAPSRPKVDSPLPAPASPV